MRLSKERLEEIRGYLLDETGNIKFQHSFLWDCVAEILALKSELESVKDSGDGKSMEIGALRSSFESICKERETLQERINTLHKDNRFLQEKIKSDGIMLVGLLKLLEKYKIIRSEQEPTSEELYWRRKESLGIKSLI